MDIIEALKQSIDTQDQDNVLLIIKSRLNIQTKAMLLSNILKKASDKQKNDILQWFNNEANNIKDSGQMFYDTIGKINDFNIQSIKSYVQKEFLPKNQKNIDSQSEELKYPEEDSLSDIISTLQKAQANTGSDNIFNFDINQANVQNNSLQSKIFSLTYEQISIQQLVSEIDIKKIKSLDFAAKQILLKYLSIVNLDKSELDAPINKNVQNSDKESDEQQSVQEKILKIAEQLEIRAMIWIYQFGKNQLKEIIIKQILESIIKNPHILDNLRDYELLRFLMEYYAEYVKLNKDIPTLKEQKSDENNHISLEQHSSSQILFFTNSYISHLAKLFVIQITNKPIQDVTIDNNYPLLQYLNRRLPGLYSSKQQNKNFQVRQMLHIEIYFLLYYITFYQQDIKMVEQKGIEYFINYLSAIQNNVFIVQANSSVKVSIYKLDQLNTSLCTQINNDLNNNNQLIEHCSENYILNNQKEYKNDSHQQNTLMNKYEIDQIFNKWIIDENECWKQFTITSGPLFIDSLDNYVIVFEADKKKMRFNRLQHHLINSSMLNLQNGPNTQIKLSIFNGVDQIIELNEADYEVINEKNANVVTWTNNNNKTFRFIQANKTHRLFIKYKYSQQEQTNSKNILIQHFSNIFKQNIEHNRYIKIQSAEYYYEYITILPTIPIISSTLFVIPNVQQLIQSGTRKVNFYISLIAQSNSSTEYQFIDIARLPQNVISLKQTTMQNIESLTYATLEEVTDDDKEVLSQYGHNDSQKWYKFSGEIQNDTIQMQIGCKYVVYGSNHEIPNVFINLVDREKVFTLNCQYSNNQLNIQVFQTANMIPASNLDIDVQLGNQKQSITTDINGLININNVSFDQISKIQLIIAKHKYVIPVQQRQKINPQLGQIQYIKLNNVFQICLQEWNSADQQYIGKIQDINDDEHATMMFQPIFNDNIQVSTLMSLLQFTLPEKKIFEFKVKCNGLISPVYMRKDSNAQNIISSILNMTQKTIYQAQNNDYKYSIDHIFENCSENEPNDDQYEKCQPFYDRYYNQLNTNVSYSLSLIRQESVKLFNPNYSMFNKSFNGIHPSDKKKLYQLTNSGMIYESYDDE